MTLNERFVGGNPRVLLLLLCLFCVILICFAGICSNMIRKKKKNLEAMTRSLARPVPVMAMSCLSKPTKKKSKPKEFHKLGTARACGGTAVPPQPKFFFYFFLVLPSFKQHNLFNPSTSLSKPSYLHNSLQTSPNHNISKPNQL